MHQFRNCFLVTIVISILVGCASGRPSYQPPTGDLASLATLKMSDKYLGLLLIDGTEGISTSEFVFSGKGYPGTYIVTPGKHTVRAIYGNRNHMDLWIIAEPGKEYLLRLESEAHKFRMFFQDTSNAKVVGGLVGSDDEPK